MKRNFKRFVAGAIAAVMMLSSGAIVASASGESYDEETGTVTIYMDTANRAYWSDRYISAYDRHFGGVNFSSSQSTVNVLGQSYRSDTGWITQDYWSLAPANSFANYYTYAKTTSQWRVQLRTVTDRYDSYALASMYA